MLSNWQEICNQFIEATSYKLGDLEQNWYLKVDMTKKPELYFSYPHVLERIPLGKPNLEIRSDSIWNLLRNRRS